MKEQIVKLKNAVLKHKKELVIIGVSFGAGVLVKGLLNKSTNMDNNPDDFLVDFIKNLNNSDANYMATFAPDIVKHVKDMPEVVNEMFEHPETSKHLDNKLLGVYILTQK